MGGLLVLRLRKGGRHILLIRLNRLLQVRLLPVAPLPSLLAAPTLYVTATQMVLYQLLRVVELSHILSFGLLPMQRHPALVIYKLIPIL